jgi:mRNA interferase RelE/StbE
VNWNVIYLPEARDDLSKLDGSQRILVQKAIKKVSKNPLPNIEGGYGKPLGNKNNVNLTGLLKIKLRSAGIRVVYQLERTERGMFIVVIGVREDDEVYQEAEKRVIKLGNNPPIT